MSREALRTLLVASIVNALLTFAYPAALVSLFYVSDIPVALRLLAILFILMAAVSCFTLLGVRRYLVTECGFAGASGSLAVHAGISAASGIAILIGWGVLRLGSINSDLSWALGLTVLGFFLVIGIAIGILELLISRALGGTTADGYGLLGPIRISFFIAGTANLISIVVGVTVIVGMIAYAVVFALFVLLFYAGWRDRAGNLPEGFRFGKGWLSGTVCVAVLSIVVPGAVAIYELRSFIYD